MLAARPDAQPAAGQPQGGAQQPSLGARMQGQAMEVGTRMAESFSPESTGAGGGDNETRDDTTRPPVPSQGRTDLIDGADAVNSRVQLQAEQVLLPELADAASTVGVVLKGIVAANDWATLLEMVPRMKEKRAEVDQLRAQLGLPPLVASPSSVPAE